MSLDRIAALLAKAERTDNEAEAEAYLIKAQQLATLASIDLAVARARTSSREVRQAPISRTTTIGEKGRRANPHLIALYVAIAHSNDAKVDIAANSTYVIGYGMPSDLDVIESIFASLAVQMVEASQRYLALGEWRGETYVAVVQRRSRRKEHTAQTARAAFYQAYVRRIDERLAQARADAVATSPAMAAPVGTEATSEGALVLRRKEKEVASFHRQTSQARGSWGGYSGGVRGNAGSASAAGRSAASRARLTEQRGIGSNGPALPG